MATLTNGQQNITVPDGAAADYIKQGWQRPTGAPPREATAEPPAKKSSRRRGTTAPKAKSPKGT